MANTYYVNSGEVFTTDEVLVQLDAIHVYSGGTVRNVVFSGGDCTVYSGGLIEGGMFSNDSDLRLTAGARALNVAFGVNGRLRIESGSIAEGLVLSESARVNFLVDGQTTLEGVMSTAGGDVSFEITGNQCMGLVVNAGSSLTVGDGCVADEIIVGTNGTLNLLSGSTVTNVVLGAGAKLYLPPDGKTTLSGKDSDGNDFSIDGKDVKGLTILPKRMFTLGDETATESDHWKGIGMTVREEGHLIVHAWSLLEDLKVESLGYRLGSVILQGDGIEMKDAVVAGRIVMSKEGNVGYYAVDCAGTDFTFSVVGRGNDETVYNQPHADELAGPIVESLAHLNNAELSVLAAASQKFGRYTLAGNAGVIADLDDKVQLKVGDREFEYVVTGGALEQRSDVVGISVYELKQDSGAFVLDVTKDLTYTLTLNDQLVCEVARGFAGADATSFTVQVFSRDDLADAMTIESNIAACDIYSGRAWSGVRARLLAGEASSDPMSFGNWSEYGQATKVESDGDGIGDLFLASSNATWDCGYVALHSVLGETLCAVSLDGKLRYEDTFVGSADASVLCLTDDACGDALFLDDVFTILGDEARVTGIDEIRLGAGDDVLDLTSDRYFDASGKSMLIRGGDGNDVIYAGNVETTLINGGSGDDILVGGGVGNDVFLFADDFGSDRVYQFGEGGITLVFAEDLVVPQSIVDGEDLVYEFSNNRSVRLVGWAGKHVTIGNPEDYAYGLAVDPGIRLQ